MKKTADFSNVSEKHEKMIESFNIPTWITDQICSKCENKIGDLSIRAIGLKFNAKHIGNFFVDICCKKCNYGYELHIRKACSNIDDFINLLGKKEWTCKMESDYLMEYNDSNLIQEILEETKEKEDQSNGA